MRHALSGLFGLILAFGAADAVAAETKSFAVSWFHTAVYYDKTGQDCPTGLNPNSRDYYRRELQRLGYTPAQIEDYIANFLEPKNFPVVINRGRIDGKPVNVYANPTSVPDPNLKLVEGRFGYGFNLDGKTKPADFTDPLTGERGVDNQYYRVVGCISGFRRLSENERPRYPSDVWTVLFEQMPAWIVEISGIDDMQNDPDVRIGLYRAFESLKRDSSGNAQSHMTFRIDPNPRSQNAVRARIENGVITSDVFDFNMLGDPMWIQEHRWRDARFRLKINENGTLTGLAGGYLPWFPLYWQHGSDGWGVEATNNLDLPGYYYALRKSADAYPDPKTGENTAISAAYDIEGVPAFALHPDRKVADR